MDTFAVDLSADRAQLAGLDSINLLIAPTTSGARRNKALLPKSFAAFVSVTLDTKLGNNAFSIGWFDLKDLETEK